LNRPAECKSIDSTRGAAGPRPVPPQNWRPFARIILVMLAGLLFGAWGLNIARAAADAPGTLAAGGKLYVRLELIVSTRSSHLNEPISVRVVRDIVVDNSVLIPIGSEVSGKITKVIPPATPSDHAKLLIRFTQLSIPHHAAMPLTAHLLEVENARETVLPDGTILGILEKDAAAGRVDGVFSKLGSAGGEMNKVSNKTLGKVDTAIEFPAGTDLILNLDQPLTITPPSPPTAAPELTPALASAVQKLLSGAPQRVESKAKKPGDPLNLIFIGTSEQILNAFTKAGWGEAKKLGTKSAMGTVRAMASDNSYEDAPVSQLYLYGRTEDLAFEKTLNTFLKRHHLRIWQTLLTTPNGRPLWIGAATHDIGLDVHFRVVSHQIDPNLDTEREKVGADLMASGLVKAEQLVSRPNPLTEGGTATGGTWKTDGQLLVIEVKPTRVPASNEKPKTE
jgi:hypothetical protein